MCLINIIANYLACNKGLCVKSECAIICREIHSFFIFERSFLADEQYLQTLNLAKFPSCSVTLQAVITLLQY